jgi:SAM-dependent methyltransferase
MTEKNSGCCCGSGARPEDRANDSTPKTKDDLRLQVSEAYSQAIQKARAGRGGCCGDATAAGVAAQTAGYTSEEKAAFTNAAQSSFGCGSPLAFARVEEGQTVLDLGSGAGFDLLIASQRVGRGGHVIGVDMTDAMLDAASENIRRALVENVELRKGTIEDLPVEDASVDWVISNCVINLSPEKSRVFAEIARVLRSGGHFSVSDIVVEDLPQELRTQAAIYSACIGGAISESEYLAGLRAAGLSDVTVTERNVYDETQLRDMVASDLEAMGVPGQLLDAQLKNVVGKVWSAKFSGRRA